MPNKRINTLPKIYTITCDCKKKNALQDDSAASSVLHV